MEMKNPYLLLIDNCLGRLSLKYGTPFKYEVKKKDNISYTFTIYQEDDPIYSKEIPVVDNSEIIDHVHYEICKEFFIGSIERIFMQRENAKKIFPREHAKIKEKLGGATGKW